MPDMKEAPHWKMLWAHPEMAKVTCTRKEAHDFLAEHPDGIIAKGFLRPLVIKHLGVGVYRVTLDMGEKPCPK